MAEKRMISNQIINSDEFAEMPIDAQMLYVRLNLAADDRGICDKPRQVMNICRSADDCMKILIAKKFVIVPQCRPSVVVIKHWWINNNLRSQRFKETRYLDVLDELFYDENKSYSKNPENHFPCVKDGTIVTMSTVDQWLTNGRPMSDHWLPQYSTVQSSTVQYSSVQGSPEERGTGEEERPPADSLMDSSMRRELIARWRNKIDIFRRLKYDPEHIYRIAEAAGVSREEIDNYKEEIS